jgi:bifunctional DNA-binding transcriptional regulator/antitoxin component of YhaV-PrlF toxin-antitoxin module
MKALRLSEDGTITLPAELRKMTGAKPGQRFIAVPVGRAIMLTPDEPASALRGIARGADPTGYR